MAQCSLSSQKHLACLRRASLQEVRAKLGRRAQFCISVSFLVSCWHDTISASLFSSHAQRGNAQKSTGPVTEEGKLRSRRNAVRHGLTAETVIGALEDAEDYRAFEQIIMADYDAQSAVERELVLRLASVLWRLRRATTMETGLFDIQADHLNAFKQTRPASLPADELLSRLLGERGWLSESNRSPTNGITKQLIMNAMLPDQAARVLNSRVASCGSPTYPISRSIGSAATRPRCGAKLAKSYLHLMP
jgi:hypothetical protein